VNICLSDFIYAV